MFDFGFPFAVVPKGDGISFSGKPAAADGFVHRYKKVEG